MATLMATLALHARPIPRALGISHLAIAAIAAAGLWLQLSAFINHDVAWILWGTEKMIAGAVWGRDIIEPNPPLAWYLSVPSTWLALKLGLPVAACFQIAVTAAAFVSVLTFERLLRGNDDTGARASALPALVAAIVLMILPYRDFGQREHLLLIAILPYLALTAHRIHGGAVSPVTAGVIGLIAGLGLALKPYFLAIPAVVEVAALLITRRWSFPIRTETVAIGGVIVAYVCLLLVQSRYLVQVVPLAQGIYWSFNLPLRDVVIPLLPPLVAVVAAAIVTRQRTASFLMIAAATAGLAIACLAQHKGYSYHQYPVWAGAALAVSVATTTAEGARRHLGYAILAGLLLVGGAKVTSWWQANQAGGARAVETHRVIDVIDRYARNGRFLVVAVHPYPAFPAALYADADWSSRTNSQWFLPAVAQLRHSGSDREALAFAEQHARAFILHDLSQDPRLVIIDTNARRHTRGPGDFDILAFYLEDPRFAAIWSSYREVGSIGTYRLFARRDLR